MAFDGSENVAEPTLVLGGHRVHQRTLFVGEKLSICWNPEMKKKKKIFACYKIVIDRTFRVDFDVDKWKIEKEKYNFWVGVSK